MSNILLTLDSFGMGKRGRKKRMRRAADIVMAEWGAEASQKMSAKSAMVYKSSLAIVEVTESRALVALGSSKSSASARAVKLAMMLEHGLGPAGVGSFGPFDLRKTLLKGGTKRIRTGKKGLYLHVPFKVAGKTIQALGGASIRRFVGSKQFKHSIQGGKHKTLYGSSLNAGHAAKLKSHHSTDPLHGLHKFGSKYSGGRTRTSGFGTFRTISQGGKPWTHPGIKPRRVADKVRKGLYKILGELL